MNALGKSLQRSALILACDAIDATILDSWCTLYLLYTRHILIYLVVKCLKRHNIIVSVSNLKVAFALSNSHICCRILRRIITNGLVEPQKLLTILNLTSKVYLTMCKRVTIICDRGSDADHIDDIATVFVLYADSI